MGRLAARRARRLEGDPAPAGARHCRRHDTRARDGTGHRRLQRGPRGVAAPAGLSRVGAAHHRLAARCAEGSRRISRARNLHGLARAPPELRSDRGGDPLRIRSPRRSEPSRAPECVEGDGRVLRGARRPARGRKSVHRRGVSRGQGRGGRRRPRDLVVTIRRRTRPGGQPHQPGRHPAPRDRHRAGEPRLPRPDRHLHAADPLGGTARPPAADLLARRGQAHERCDAGARACGGLASASSRSRNT